jgi:hypothetical protein
MVVGKHVSDLWLNLEPILDAKYYGGHGKRRMMKIKI